jgi:hypothetical protein
MPAVPDTVGERLNSLLHIPSWGPTRRNLHERRVRMKQLRDEMMTLFLAGC